MIKWIAPIEWALIFGALAFFTVTETYQDYVALGLGLLTLFYAERGVRGKLISARTGLQLPILLFILSAGIAVWNAYDQETALLQFARILAATAIFIALSDNESPYPEIIAIGFLTAASVLAIYWPSKNDFLQFPSKFEWINSIGSWLNAHFPPPPGPEVHGNVAAGTLLVSLPFGAALVWQAIKEKNLIAGLLSAWLTLTILMGLLLTASRGAWVGLAGMITAALLVLLQRRWFQTARGKAIFWAGIFSAGIFLLALVIVSGNVDKLVGQIPDPTGTMQSRIVMWREAVGLIRDYFFTGSGLQTYWMVNAAYALLIHVRFIAHSHNSFLQIWIEQGLLGVAAVVWGGWIVFKWGWRAIDKKNISPLGWAGLAALIGAAIHGMVDVVFYIERTLPIIGLALGYASLTQVRDPEPERASPIRSVRLIATLLALVGLGIAGIIFHRPIAAAWYANLGALSQTQVELSRYNPDQFNKLSLDQVRQTSDLSKAEALYKKSLDYQPDNLTSHQRLSEIGLARGENLRALSWMETAWSSGKRDTVTRLLYADALIANGQIDDGVRIIKGLTWAENRLLNQAWYRYWESKNYPLAANFWKAALSLNPSNKDAARNLNNVQNILNP